MIRVPFSMVHIKTLREGILNAVVQGGVLVYPTDTLYGLGGNFFSPEVHQRIDRLKAREEAMPYSAALGSLDMLGTLTDEVPDVFMRELAPLLPGPYTFLFNASRRINPALLKGRKTVGIRVPDLPPILALIKASGIPWITTSVNRSGQVPVSDPLEIIHQFPDVDLLIDAGKMLSTHASTVVDLSQLPPRIFRAGAGLDRIQEIMARWR